MMTMGISFDNLNGGLSHTSSRNDGVSGIFDAVNGRGGAEAIFISLLITIQQFVCGIVD